MDGDGSISENELVKPLVSLGLAPDHKFARKICNALVPTNRVHQGGVDLQLEDFLRIFRSDRVQDALMAVIKRASDKKFN